MTKPKEDCILSNLLPKLYTQIIHTLIPTEEKLTLAERLSSVTWLETTMSQTTLHFGQLRIHKWHAVLYYFRAE